MRNEILSSAIALSLLLGAAETAVAQTRGPPDKVMVGRQLMDLDQRLQALEQKLASHPSNSTGGLLAQARALHAQVRGAGQGGEVDTDALEAEVARLEKAAG